MDMVLVSGIGLGLALGSFGYVLVRFVLRPLRTYRRLKSRLADSLQTAARAKALTDDARNTLRHTSSELQQLLDDELPVWYTLALKKKDEKPREAVPHLQALVNCREPSAILKRVKAVQQSMRL
jgi:hypothetical protein